MLDLICPVTPDGLHRKRPWQERHTQRSGLATNTRRAILFLTAPIWAPLLAICWVAMHIDPDMRRG